MYHIVKTKSKKFQVVLVGKNREPLSTSELLNSKQSSMKNIKAQCEQNGAVCASYQDDTLKIPVAFSRNFIEESFTTLTTFPKYIPGKNPKKKK